MIPPAYDTTLLPNIRYKLGTTDWQIGTAEFGTIKIDNQRLKMTFQFEYLGSIVISNNDATFDTWRRVKEEWLEWRQIRGILYDK